jgi:hypothetical protein
VSDTIPCDPPDEEERTEFATVRAIDWSLSRVTIELRLPPDIEQMPDVDDEVRVSWPRRTELEK